MFSTPDFVEEWNQIFTFKIKESDMAKPTEFFVFNALINYLKMFNFDTAPMIQMKNSENSIERRSFLIRFCNYIDHIYKISDKSHCFVYYDLQHPAPKKTVHMLNHLLNYLFYYNMFKDSIIPVANARIREMKQLLDKINKNKYENEQIVINTKRIEKSIEEYRTAMPQTLTELHELLRSEAAEKELISGLEKQLEDCNSLLESMREEEARLTLKIVSQDEVDRLLSSKDTLMNAIDEQESIESSTYAKSKEHSATLVELQSLMSSIDDAMDLNLNLHSVLKSYNECSSKYKELESKFAAITPKKEELGKIHEKKVDILKKIEKESNFKTNLLKDMKPKGEKEIAEMEALFESNKISISNLEHELHTANKQVEEEKNVTAYILENTATLVKATMANCSDAE